MWFKLYIISEILIEVIKIIYYYELYKLLNFN